MNLNDRILAALDNIVRIYDQHIEPDDHVSFVTFNTSVKVHFCNEKKSTSRGHLEKIRKCDEPNFATAWIDALGSACAMPSGSDPNHPLPKYIICLTDGADNESTMMVPGKIGRLGLFALSQQQQQ